MEAEWFAHPDWWFNCDANIDLYITQKYEHLLDGKDSQDSLESILRYDQLVRHVFRGQHASHIISFFLRKALEVFDNMNIHTLNDTRLCFALLPSRHSGDLQRIYGAMHVCWERLQTTQENRSILQRFLKATYDKCPLIGAMESLCPHHLIEDFSDILENSLLFDFHGCSQGTVFSQGSQDVSRLLSSIPKIDSNIIIASVSGGPDSMLMLHTLIKIYGPLKIIALHINYANRPSSDKEAAFVETWCRSHNVRFYVRRIHEIKRAPCKQYGLRETYEKYTRNVRYQCYRDFGPSAIIALGHNKDDKLENIFTNIAQGAKYENLDGMQEFNTTDNITFWRPFLELTKNEILRIAKSCNIPYLPCSTPEWSMRGQIRNSVVPCLDQWNPQFVKNLHHLSSTVSDLYSVLNDKVADVVKTATREHNKITFALPVLNTTLVFWRTLFESLGLYNISSKSIGNLIFNIGLENKKDIIKVILNKDTTLLITGTRCTIIIK